MVKTARRPLRVMAAAGLFIASAGVGLAGGWAVAAAAVVAVALLAVAVVARFYKDAYPHAQRAARAFTALAAVWAAVAVCAHIAPVMTALILLASAGFVFVRARLG